MVGGSTGARWQSTAAVGGGVARRTLVMGGGAAG